MLYNKHRNRHIHNKIPLRKEFQQLQFAGYAMQKLLDNYEFETVLDIGAGSGNHSDIFIQQDKAVTQIDHKQIPQKSLNPKKYNKVIADFVGHEFKDKFDCVWCSHVLEHQLNPHVFLSKIYDTLKETGVLAITVPPSKQQIVSGHVSLWNAGLLLYHLVLAKFNCQEASVYKYGYNISIIVEKRTIETMPSPNSSNDICLHTIREYLPRNLRYINHLYDSFDGDIDELNWAK